jgi:hypothetical protein
MWLSGNGRMQNTLNSYISQMACCLLVTEETDGSQFVSIMNELLACARNPVSDCFTCKLTSKTYSWHMTPQYHAAVGLIVTFLWHYVIVKRFEGEWKVSQWFIFSIGDKECSCIVESILTTRGYLFSWRCSVRVLLKTYVPNNVILKSH